jgi:hypothetical protein
LVAFPVGLKNKRKPINLLILFLFILGPKD